MLLSDTHSHVDERIFAHAEAADEIWHAGDIGSVRVSDALEKVKPFRAVYGNIDGQALRIRYPEMQEFECEGVSVLMRHIAGYPGKYNAKTRYLLDRVKPKLFICGHSHILKVVYDKKREHLHMNPGAAGKAGFHQMRTMLRFELNAGKIENAQVIELGLRGELTHSVDRTD